MSDLPTPRELLIALHADWRLSRRELGRLVGEALGRALAPLAADPAARTAAPAPAVPRGARGRTASPPPAWATPDGAIAAAAAEVATAAALGARVVTILDADYPEMLAAIPLPPPVLLVRGTLPPGPAVAIVGSRLADAYGREVTGQFARALAGAGVAIVSGLAHGIDTAAHEGALAVTAGRTIAVLGCGLAVDYPPGQARLAAAIAAHGALVSEFPCDAAAQPWRFPVRNRTIAGLATATLVVQATPRSGALDTARHARDLGRAVYAVPGPVGAPLSWGPHALLRRGALLAGHPEDLLDALPRATRATRASESALRRVVKGEDEESEDATPAAAGEDAAPAADSPTADTAARVLAALRPRAARAINAIKTAEQVTALTGLAADTVLCRLLELEVAGRVERLPGLGYRLAKRGATRHATIGSGGRTRREGLR
jgi:DNA processing protein